MTDKELFNIFRNLGQYNPMSGYYTLKISDEVWSAVNYGFDGSIHFYNKNGETTTQETIYRLTNWK